MASWTFVRASVALLRIVNVIYVFVFLGVLSAVPEYIASLSWALTAAVSLLLLTLFHPFRSGGAKAITTLDGDLAALIFAAGFMLFTNVVLTGAASIPYIKDWMSAGRRASEQTKAAVSEKMPVSPGGIINNSQQHESATATAAAAVQERKRK